MSHVLSVVCRCGDLAMGDMGTLLADEECPPQLA